MSEQDTVEVNMKGFDNLMASMKGPLPVIRLGILGNASRTGDQGVTNAEIGAQHEYGANGVPMRSWLRLPVIEHLEKYLEKAGPFDEDELREYLRLGTIVPLLKKMSVIAEALIADAFASNGFGKWAPWKNGYQSRTGNILVDTQQLRNAVLSEVKA